ncbi:MAG: hypothetical protein LBB48_02455 [Treponema sp.]|nr:hypothetical protein [Treponema sp.]
METGFGGLILTPAEAQPPFPAMKSPIPPPRKPDAGSPRSPAGSGNVADALFDTLREVFQTTCKARGTPVPRAGTPIDYDI